MSVEQAEGTAEITVKNIGGIERASVSFDPGVTLLVGNNATNRTSFLTAVMAVMGSDRAALKGDTDEGRVSLSLDGQSYTRELRRNGSNITTSGTPYLDDPTLGDLFAFLLKDNEARRAVVQGADLREIIMQPVDTDEIQAEIDRLRQRRDDLERELEEIDSLKGRLPTLEQKRRDLQQQIEEKKAELEETEAKLRERDTAIEESQKEKDEMEQKLSELQQKRGALDDIRYDLETEQDSLTELRSEFEELSDERSELSDAPSGELDEIESELNRLRKKKQTLEGEISELQSIIQFNEDMLDEEGFLSSLEVDGTEQKALTDQLVPDETMQCWTCGNTVETEQIEATVDTLRGLSESKFQQAQDIDEQIATLKQRKEKIERNRKRREKLDRQIQRIEENIEQSESRVEKLRQQRDDLTDTIESMEAAIDEQEDEQRSEVLRLHKEANQLEYTLGQLENDRERIEDEISSISETLDNEERLRSDLEEVKTQIRELRTKIDSIEQDAVDEFNRHMDAILDRLGYGNLERIWLERLDTEVREGRQKVSKTVFELHVIRSTASGTSYEDTVDHLSESEREVTGLIFALAGYLTHDVYETVPFMVLDSLEAIDAQRIAKLVDYFEGYSEYLVVALLPEDAAALDEAYDRVTEINS
jgi:chromosome segregation ATPase